MFLNLDHQVCGVGSSKLMACILFFSFFNTLGKWQIKNGSFQWPNSKYINHAAESVCSTPFIGSFHVVIFTGRIRGKRLMLSTFYWWFGEEIALANRKSK
jgi:hypothetical protein